mmetsp:Transcript_419/g.749  ORF Transcript_419/g.749 Transcript_419/m.749 type:complete len:390 (+) Transcript_419:176-1345(+)|eukprot:CAMPEP_0202497616 /NCGR_PEP_ID=MMETSP1361-20130828/23336_1 /ASSEMBLY_ACC=CAM_ASM_000849 /TAXON_ID=210615 /ORGANISM="Staurosira complex sp., Strain CCMP2646" /LENGTH=389 /DNA_ID=CAMNT_0049129265 /DNA_START=112 /DNA_END=1281 /DNA_ORIENTATION=+
MASTPPKWSVDQLVNVKPRTWAGINRPGGVGKITKLHYSNGFIESLDVKYLVGSGSDTNLDLDFIEAYEPLESNGRARRGRDFYTASPAKRGASREKQGKDKDRPAKKAKKTSSKPVVSKQVEGDENTDPKKSASKAARKMDKGTTKKKKEEKMKPPATYVVVNKKCSVSPLADTPAELRAIKKKPASKSTPSNKTVRKSLHGGGGKSCTNPTVVPPTSARPNNIASTFQTKAVSLATKCAAAPSKASYLNNPRKLPSSKQQANRVPLKRVFDSQVDRANTFVEGLVGKPKAATSLKDTTAKAAISTDCAVTLSPPTNTERIDLFVSKLSELFGDDDDGVDKDELLEKVNKKLSAEGNGHFDHDEMEDCLAALSSDGKVMVSDGIVYSF